jgi:hypothetical protein
MLTEYNFEIIYRTGKLMGKPDALSRRFDLVEGTKTKEQRERVLISGEKWDLESFKLMAMETGEGEEEEEEEEEEGENEEEELKLVPEEDRMNILKLVHDDLSAGHFDEKKTYELLTRNYWWPSEDDPKLCQNM